MPVRLIESLATTEPLAEIFSDLSVLQAMLDFEVALARAEKLPSGPLHRATPRSLCAAGRSPRSGPESSNGDDRVDMSAVRRERNG